MALINGEFCYHGNYIDRCDLCVILELEARIAKLKGDEVMTDRHLDPPEWDDSEEEYTDLGDLIDWAYEEGRYAGHDEYYDGLTDYEKQLEKMK
ncbi:MAG: hypothetical protein ACR2PH_04055 [Desulfobulbia bacterium]